MSWLGLIVAWRVGRALESQITYWRSGKPHAHPLSDAIGECGADIRHRAKVDLLRYGCYERGEEEKTTQVRHDENIQFFYNYQLESP